MQPKTKGEGDEKAEEVETEIPFMKGYAVFNAEQIDGLPAHFYATVAAITGKGAGFRSLNDTWADTTTAHGRLMLTVLGGLAEFERELIRARTGEGRARAVANGVRLGRKPILTHHQQLEAVKRLKAGKET
ncbi:MAG TPA: recombinase family protein [Methylocella sp.]|nr:recombinase family protein [Methylocella sp.]